MQLIALVYAVYIRCQVLFISLNEKIENGFDARNLRVPILALQIGFGQLDCVFSRRQPVDAPGQRHYALREVGYRPCWLKII